MPCAIGTFLEIVLINEAGHLTLFTCAFLNIYSAILDTYTYICEKVSDVAQNDFLIGQIIAKCHSFPNMYVMLQAKVARLAGKTYLVQKNT